jgi:lipopolysaccharide assembly outer membrane protein LptD (OstA)
VKRPLSAALLLLSVVILGAQEETGSPLPVEAEQSVEGEAPVEAEQPEQPDAEADAAAAAAGDAGEQLVEGEAPEKPDELDAARRVVERDIETSTLSELADWCRSLGLNESGSKEDLAARLRVHYQITAAPAEEDQPKQTLIITIESAQTTEYFTITDINEEYARLRGGVVVSLKDGEINHRIEAEEILYNRTRKLMTASGGVKYERVEGDTHQGFTGEGITINLDTWSTAFMQGISDRSITGGETNYRFAGEVISRSGEDSTVLRRAEITNGSDDEAYWSINASKLWLLPGFDWAVLNAVIKVGKIPLLYLPVFFYPGNEIAFHPVFGYRSREGSYLQTTTYLMGRPTSGQRDEESVESTLTSIMGSGEGMEKKLEGVFLRSTGRRARSETETKLSLLADAYTNMGFYAGGELLVPQRGHFGQISVSAGLGYSRDIAQYSGSFTPFYPDFDGSYNWNDSKLFSYDLPFRYRFATTGSVGGSNDWVASANLAWSFPLYSDPYIDNDFMRRSEDSSLFNIIKTATTPDTTINTDSISNYEWRLSGNLGLSVPFLTPYISTISLNSAASSITFDNKLSNPAPDSALSYPSDRYFFYPNKFTAYSLSASIGGTPLTIGGTQAPLSQTDASVEIAGVGTALPPWESAGAGDSAEDSGELRPPALGRSIVSPLMGGSKFAVDYRINPSSAQEIKYNTQDWNNKEAIDWNDYASQLFSFRTDGNLGLTLSENRGIYTTSIRFYETSSYQDYTYLNRDAPEYKSPQAQEAAERQVNNMTYFTSSTGYDFTLRPFYQSEIWKDTNFQYSVRGLLWKSTYDQNSDSWKKVTGKWTKEDLEYNRTAANFAATIMDKTQNLSITADLPPEDAALGANATVRVWISETNTHTQIKEPFKKEERVYEPVYFTETLTFTPQSYFRHYMVYDPELEEFTSVTSGLTLGPLTASFTAIRTRGYFLADDPDPSATLPTGWYPETSAAEILRPQQLSIAYSETKSTDTGGRLDFGVGVNTGLTFDLQRYTYSKFFFTLKLTANINRFLDASLSSHSENSVIYRYFQGSPLFNSNLEAPGEKNVLVDLVNSFRFDDIKKRQESGFKLKSFSLDFVHHLGDWDASLTINLTPEFDQRTMEYRFKSDVAFLMQWKPIKEFKSKIEFTDDKGLSYE